MGRYVLRRLLQTVGVVLVTTFLVYWIVWALPGDPFAYRCGERPCPESYVSAMRAKFHLDEPLLEQYRLYLGSLAQGDLGTTYRGYPVVDDLLAAYPATLKLSVLAIGIQSLVGIVAGVLAGLRRGGFVDNLVLLSTLMVIGIPIFVLGNAAQVLVANRWGWASPTVGSGAPWSELLLPAFVLASLSLAYVARLTRTTLAENLRADYVRTATAKGLSRLRVVVRHAARNSMIPVITFIGADFGALLGGAVVTERIFNIRGVGGLLFRSITSREGATVVGVITVLVLVVLLVNLLVDILYAVLDPRIRYQ